MIQKILKRFDSAVMVRTQFDRVFSDLTKYYSPYRNDFIGGGAAWNQPNSVKSPRTDLLNTEGANAAEQLVSSICTGLINYANPWFALTLANQPEADVETRRFLESATDIISGAINDTSANFYDQAHEFVSDLVIYGTAAMYIAEDEDTGGIAFCAIPFGEIYISEDPHKKIDSVFRLFKMTAAQIVEKWPDTAPEGVKNDATQNPDNYHEIVHVAMKRSTAAITGMTTSTKMPIASYYILKDGTAQLSESGYHEMPYVVARWTRRAGEVYGRSPAWVALPDVKMANAIQKTLIETSERQGNPPYLVADDGVITQLRLAPGQPIVGGLDSVSGNPRIQPMQVGGNIPINLQMLQKVEQGIRDRFFVGALQQYNPGVEKTATEVMEFRREESRLMGPQIGKLQSEMLEPIVLRVRNILQRKKRFPPLPQGLVGISVNLDYTSPLAKLQKTDDVDAVTRTVNSVLPFLQVDPTLMDNFNIDQVFQHIAEVSGVPANLIRSPEEVAAMRQDRQAQQNAMATAQALQMASEASKNFSQANKADADAGRM